MVDATPPIRMLKDEACIVDLYVDLLFLKEHRGLSAWRDAHEVQRVAFDFLLDLAAGIRKRDCNYAARAVECLMCVGLARHTAE